MNRREIQPASVPAPVAEYAHGVEVTGGRTLYIAGQVALDADGQLVGPGDIRAQTRQVLSNIQAIIEEAGATTVIPPGLPCHVDDYGNYHIRTTQ